MIREINSDGIPEKSQYNDGLKMRNFVQEGGSAQNKNEYHMMPNVNNVEIDRNDSDIEISKQQT